MVLSINTLESLLQINVLWRFPPIQTIKSLPKKSVKYIPGFGQLLWALEFPFLERNNYQKDKESIAAIAKVYKTLPFPAQV